MASHTPRAVTHRTGNLYQSSVRNRFFIEQPEKAHKKPSYAVDDKTPKGQTKSGASDDSSMGWNPVLVAVLAVAIVVMGMVATGPTAPVAAIVSFWLLCGGGVLFTLYNAFMAIRGDRSSGQADAKQAPVVGSIQLMPLPQEFTSINGTVCPEADCDSDDDFQPDAKPDTPPAREAFC